MVMLHVFPQGLVQGPAAKEDHPVQAFVFQGSHEALDMGIQVWTPGREHDGFDLREPFQVLA